MEFIALLLLMICFVFLRFYHLLALALLSFGVIVAIVRSWNIRRS